VTNAVSHVASVDGVVQALDAASGKSLWRKRFDRRLHSGLSIDDQQVYVSDVDGYVLALSLSDGSLVWEYLMSSEVNAPVGTNGEIVVIRGADGRVVTLSANDGVERWSKTYSPPPLTVRGYSQPLLVSKGVLLGLDDGNLIALALDSGRTLWQSEIASASGRSEIERMVDIDADPLIDDQHIYAVSFQGNLAQLEPGRGRQTWSIPMSSVVGMSQGDDALYLVDASDHVIAVGKQSGDTLWKNTQLEGRHLTRPVLVGNQVVVADFEGYLHVLSTKDGSLSGRGRAGNAAVNVAPVLVGDSIIVYPNDAKLRSFRLGSG